MESFWFLMLFVLSMVCAREKARPIIISEDNWQDMLEGEWLVKFYAPWCPACKAMASTWESFAGWAEDLDVKVAEVDVTSNPGLSGRFFVTALPTIFHVKDGAFRVYRGARSENELVSFVDDKKWLDIEAMAWYKSPTAVHMGALGLFFKLSIGIRDVHNKMTSDYGIPVWGSYVIFAVATIIIGLILGLIIVFMCDVIFPQTPKRRPPSVPLSPRQAELLDDTGKDSESDIIEDDRKEVEENDDGSGDTRPKSARRRAARATTD